MYLLKIICLCLMGTQVFAASGVSEDQAELTGTSGTSVTQTPVIATTITQDPLISEEISLVGNARLDALIKKNVTKLNNFIENNPKAKLFMDKLSPYMSSTQNIAEAVDQKILLAFIAGSVVSQNDYLYPIILSTSAYFTEKSFKSITGVHEKKKVILTIHGYSLDARELLIAAGLVAMLVDRGIYSGTLLAITSGFAYTTRDQQKQFDAASFLAYMILLNKLYCLNI